MAPPVLPCLLLPLCGGLTFVIEAAFLRLISLEIGKLVGVWEWPGIIPVMTKT